METSVDLDKKVKKLRHAYRRHVFPASVRHGITRVERVFLRGNTRVIAAKFLKRVIYCIEIN